MPSPCLTGYFSLRVADTSVSFKVEEYKRPTFDVTFEPRQVGSGVVVDALLAERPVAQVVSPAFTCAFT